MDLRLKQLRQYLEGKEILVDEDDLPRILVISSWWNIIERKTDKKVYTCLDCATVYLHRVITGCPEGLVVDHKNGNGLDNRKSNLRVCTQQDNVLNKAPQRGKKYKGISKRANGSYRARITVDGYIVNIGDFTSERKAAIAYNEAAVRLHGEFARLNVIEEF